MLTRRFTLFQKLCRSHPSTIIPRTEFEKQQWKNGKGETLEMYKRDGQFRLSKATMDADADFSHFPDTVRVLLPLPNSVDDNADEPMMTIDIHGVGHSLKPMEPIMFEGESNTSAKVLR